ncbi:MAG TPA: HAD family phosphatase [Planktothrix sp.]
MIKIKAVIFDYGNVLCEPQRPTDIVTMADSLGLDTATFEPLYWRFREEYDRGDFDHTVYWQKVGTAAGKSFTALQIQNAAHADGQSWSRPSHRIMRWVRVLREHGIGTAILSNMPSPLKLFIDQNCDWLSGFDHCVYSCDVGYIKPDPEIYHHTLELLGVPAHSTLFLDDREPNIEAAKSLGIHTIHFSTLDHAASVLKEFDLPEPDLN